MPMSMDLPMTPNPDQNFVSRRSLYSDCSATQRLMAAHQLSKISVDSIAFGGSTIQPLKGVRNLSSWLETTCRMSMSVHVSTLCSKAFYGLYKIPETTKTLQVVHAFISSHLDHCNSVLYQVSPVTNLIVSKFDHISSTLYDLH